MMRQERFRKPHTLILILPLLLVLLPSAQAQLAAGQANVDRLVVGLILPYRDYWHLWINGTPDHMIQHDPAFEWLVEVSPDGQYNPWLAESWEMAQDWPFPGWDGGDIGHTFLISACKQEQPCK
jgi:ABC-type transport system substrate-binding protein